MKRLKYLKAYIETPDAVPRDSYRLLEEYFIRILRCWYVPRTGCFLWRTGPGRPALLATVLHTYVKCFDRVAANNTNYEICKKYPDGRHPGRAHFQTVSRGARQVITAQPARACRQEPRRKIGYIQQSCGERSIPMISTSRVVPSPLLPRIRPPNHTLLSPLSLHLVFNEPHEVSSP